MTARPARQPGTVTRTAKGGRPDTYPPKTKARALQIYQRAGLAAAHRSTGIPKPTITRWAKAAGLDRDAVTERNAARTREATERAAVERRRLVEEARERATVRLAGILDRSLEATQSALAGGMQPNTTMRDPALAMCSPRDLVRIWTRAVHDLAVLTGEATGDEVTASVTVVFAQPVPDRSARPIVDLGVAP